MTPTKREEWQQRGEQKWSDAQRRMLNAVCQDLSQQLRWHGMKLSKDSWRYFFSGVVLGFRAVPGWDNGDGQTGIVMIGRSSNELTRSAACDAITMAVQLGNDPSCQGLDANPVKWSDTVLWGLGWNPAELAA